MFPPYRKLVRIVDIDGTICEKKKPELYKEARAFPMAVQMVQDWYNQGDYIIIWTARPEEIKTFTENQLKEWGILHHELLMDKPWSHDIHIYDDWAPQVHYVNRDTGMNGRSINAQRVTRFTKDKD